MKRDPLGVNPELWDNIKKEWNPYFGKESAWNPGRDKLHLETKAYSPKVTVKSNIFPERHEIYNCTTCRLGEPEHPAFKIKNPDKFRVKCKGNKQWNEGSRFDDIGCLNWDRRTRELAKGD